MGAEVVEELVRLANVVVYLLVLEEAFQALDILLGVFEWLLVLLVLALEVLQELSSAILVMTDSKIGLMIQVLYQVAIFISIRTLTRLRISNLLRPHLLVGLRHLRIELVEDLTGLLHIESGQRTDLGLVRDVLLVFEHDPLLHGLDLF